MKVEFSKRAAADLLKISADSRAFGDAVAAAVERRIRRIIAHIAARPEARMERSGMRESRITR
jgi:plasmid stabilization system protein ParE